MQFIFVFPLFEYIVSNNSELNDDSIYFNRRINLTRLTNLMETRTNLDSLSLYVYIYNFEGNNPMEES